MTWEQDGGVYSIPEVQLVVLDREGRVVSVWGEGKVLLKLEWSKRHDYNRNILVPDEEPGAQREHVICWGPPALQLGAAEPILKPKPRLWTPALPSLLGHGIALGESGYGMQGQSGQH